MHDPTLLVWTVDETAGFEFGMGQPRWELAEGRGPRRRPETGAVVDELPSRDRRGLRDPSARRRITVGSRRAPARPPAGRPRLDGRRTCPAGPRGALDCDLAGCPLTNTMPILRHQLHRVGGDVTFLMAFVEIHRSTSSRRNGDTPRSGLYRTSARRSSAIARTVSRAISRSTRAASSSSIRVSAGESIRSGAPEPNETVDVDDRMARRAGHDDLQCVGHRCRPVACPDDVAELVRASSTG